MVSHTIIQCSKNKPVPLYSFHSIPFKLSGVNRLAIEIVHLVKASDNWLEVDQLIRSTVPGEVCIQTGF